jgi:hypothetical protein
VTLLLALFEIVGVEHGCEVPPIRHRIELLRMQIRCEDRMPRTTERLNGVAKERAAKTLGLVVRVHDQDIQFRQEHS